MSVMEMVRERIADLPVDAFVHSRDLVVEFGNGDRAAVDVALHRLKESAALVPVRRGLYYKGRKTRFGVTRPDALRTGYEVAKAAGFSTGVGPTGFTAARALGLTTQVPRREELSVPGRPPADTPDVHFAARSPRARSLLRPLEVAVLELLPQWPRYSEASWSTFLRRVADLERDKKVSVAAIREAARRERHVVARERAERLFAEVSARG